MKCDRTQKVSLLIDGELPQAEAQEMERHLALCGDCQSAREDFLLLRRQIADYPLELDAFARQRALRRILAAGGNATLAADGNAGGLDNRTAAPPPRRRFAFAGVFAMPRLSPAGLVALLLFLAVVAVGVASLMNPRRAPVEVVSNAPTPANNGNEGSSNATSSAQPSVPDDLTASTNKPGGGGQPAESLQKRAGAEASKGGSGNAPGVARSGANPRRTERAGAGVSTPSSTPLDLQRTRVEAPFAESARDDVDAVGDDPGARDAGGDDRRAQEGIAAQAERAGGSKTARHVEQAQLLLRSFRNARPGEPGRRASSDLAHEKQRSRKLLYENIVLRREAASRGNLPVESLLDRLEPILIDIANLPDKPAPAQVREINERMRRKNLVAMLQISAVESASARSY